jgi:hypothetical protein
MPALPYRAFTFQPYELVTDDMMNQVSANVQWLYENSPRVLYTSGRLKRKEGVRICSGKVAFQKQKDDQAQVTVHFSDFFSRFCEPNITLGLLSQGENKIFVSHSGINSLIPNHTGFRIRVEVAAEKKRDKIAKQFYVSWQAMGH